MTDRRTVISDAAISTIAREGLRGFTHRAVDRSAALAEGSTSYYFRTREALMVAALARMAELDTLDIDVPALSGPIEVDALARVLTGVVMRWLTVGRERTLARYELALESTRRPALRVMMEAHGATFRLMAQQVIAAAGAPDPARRAKALVAHLDGLLLHQLTRPGTGELDEDELRSACHGLLAVALA